MTGSDSSRLDRIERALESFSTAIALEREQRLQDVSTVRQDLAETRNTVAETAQNLAETQATLAATARNISDLTSTVSTLADLVAIQQQESQQQAERLDQLADQAERDRAQFRALIDALQQRFNGNGDGL